MSNKIMAPKHFVLLRLDLSQSNDIPRWTRRVSGTQAKRGDGEDGGYGAQGGNNEIDDEDEDEDNRDNGTDDLSPSPSPPSSPSTTTMPTSTVQTSSVTVTTLPPAVAVTSTIFPTSLSAPTSNLTPNLSYTSTFISTDFPSSAISTSFLASITPYTSLANVSSQPMKGLNSDSMEPQSTSTTNYGNALTMAAVSSTTSLYAGLPTPAQAHGKHDNGLSPTSGHVLIAFGAVGSIFILMAVAYFIARMMKIDLFSQVRCREIAHPGNGRGSSEREVNYTADIPPPKYSGYDDLFEYPSEQKVVPSQRQLDAFYSPMSIPTLATPASAAALSRGVDLRRQDIAFEALLDNPAPFGVLPADSTYQSAIQAFPSTKLAHDPNWINNPDLTYNSNAAVMGDSRHNLIVNEPAQRDVNHMSYLSSLSSGFGDQIIIPEPEHIKPINVRTSRQSYRLSRQFSWQTSTERLQGDRDTIYTTASVDSVPTRFRTINSWVAQQTGRIQKQRQTEDVVIEITEIRKPQQGRAAVDHRRRSEDSAFRYHPGDEIELSRGSRIPSTILDKKLGIR